MENGKKVEVRHLPKCADIASGCDGLRDPRLEMEIFNNHIQYVIEDVGPAADDYRRLHRLRYIVSTKLDFISKVIDYMKKEGMPFDEYNGLGPSRFNYYRAYEFSTMWIWNQIISYCATGNLPPDSWYRKYGPCLASVMRKYPKTTGILISCADLHAPGNKFYEVSKMENADFDSDNSGPGLNDAKANDFKKWVMDWCGEATEKDKMRVKNWFETKKSHKQIFAEIAKVSGNPYKFNPRLALFVERLFDQEGLDYFFEKTVFDSKEDLFMAYFDKLTQFDDETKRSFIKKYLLG